MRGVLAVAVLLTAALPVCVGDAGSPLPRIGEMGPFLGGPVADAGPDLITAEGVLVMLNGSASRPGAGGHPDELQWQQEPGVRVDVGATLDSIMAFDPDVVRLPNGTFRMYYSGWDGAHRRILSAFSQDGYSWNKEAGIRIDAGAGYDSVDAYDPDILKRPSGGLRMYYAGFNGSTYRIVSATSSDGLTWTREPGVRMEPSSGGYRVFDPDVISLPNGTLRMYFDEQDTSTIRIMSSLSQDGLDWSREPGVRLSAGGMYDSAFVAAAEVVPSNTGGFRLYYHGNDFVHSRILSARSDDGLAWTKDDGIRVDVSSPYADVRIGYPSVVELANSSLRMCYGAYDGNRYRILSALSQASQGAPLVEYGWDVSDLVDADHDGNATNDRDLLGPVVSVTYGDNGYFNATLVVVDEAGRWGIDSTMVSVANVSPRMLSIGVTAETNVTLRIAGEKWHDVRLELSMDNVTVANASIIRYPGSPDDQSIRLGRFDFNLSRRYSARVTYSPWDDPPNGRPQGATPAWIILRGPEGTESRIHHVFDAQHPETWNWSVDQLELRALATGLVLAVAAYDPGSDDLLFEVSWDDGTSSTIVVFNDGIGPDPFPSPSVNPAQVTVWVRRPYGSVGDEITIHVLDDDGGSTSLRLRV